MALLAGIDEAGYGPHLGPLVVAAAALEFAGDALPEPDLWQALRGHVRKRPSGASSRVVICDSKVAYGGCGDVAVLERAVLGFLAAMGARPRSLAELLRATGVNSATAEADPPPALPWDQPHAVALPVAADPREIETAAEHLSKGLAAAGGAAAGLWVNAASPARFNRLIDATRNKAGALFALTADLLTAVQGLRPHDPIHVTLDRHGGRRYYAGLLAGAFPLTPVETVEESAEASRYRLVRGGGRTAREDAAAPPAAVCLTVRERCETWSLPTALASMAAKYVRELAMRQMNAYFQSLVPGLRPTAGYGLDAWRFLDEVAAARAAGGVPDAAILRSR